MRSASSTCVSLRWRRSCRILRPTSSSCAGLFIRGFVDFYAAGTINSDAIYGLAELLSSPEDPENVQKRPPPPGTRQKRLSRALHRIRPRYFLGGPAAAEPRHSLLVHLHLHAQPRSGGAEQGLHRLSDRRPAAMAGDERRHHPVDDEHRRQRSDGAPPGL